MSRSTKRPQSAPLPEPGYPTLQSHLTSRRRFLGVAGAAVAVGGLATACNRALGNDTEPEPDASTSPGGAPQPQYYSLRIPGDGDLHAYLLDGGTAQFYVEVLTYEHASYLALLDSREQAADRARAALQDYTYDSLDTPQGLTGAEDDVHAALDELVMELNGHDLATLEAVTLHITALDPEPPMMGEAPFPSYP